MLFRGRARASGSLAVLLTAAMLAVPTPALSQTNLPLKPKILIGDTRVTEGDRGTTDATFAVTLSAPSAQVVTVAFATVDGTATAGSDYRAANGTLMFKAGETTQSIVVRVNGDTLPEPTETFYVRLANPTNAAIGRDQATGMIVDDDALPPTSTPTTIVTATPTQTATATVSATPTSTAAPATATSTATATATSAATVTSTAMATNTATVTSTATPTSTPTPTGTTAPPTATLTSTATPTSAPTPVVCDDGNPNTVDTYDSATGMCVFMPIGSPRPWFRDADGDGAGDPSVWVQSVDQPAGFVANALDCNDANAAIHPGAPELLDGIDNDCDGLIDEGFFTPTPIPTSSPIDCDDGDPATLDAYDPSTGACVHTPTAPYVTWYADVDGDGFGNPTSTYVANYQPPGFVANGLDCNDANGAIHPGAPELLDGIDNDCDGLIDEDTVPPTPTSTSTPTGSLPPGTPQPTPTLSGTPVVCDDGPPGTVGTYDPISGTCIYAPT